MPTNVTVEYALAEKAYREAKTPEEKLRALERMYAEVPKHKGTENLRKEIKKKISYWRKQLELSKKKNVRQTFSITKEAPTVGIIGFPNVGKSLLMKKLTNAKTIVADYEFSTKQPVVGMMQINDAKIQVIDFVPLFENVAFNDSLRQYFSPLRICDLLYIITIDNSQFDKIKLELDNFKIFLGTRKHIKIKKSSQLEVYGVENVLDGDYNTVVDVLKENGINKHVVIIEEPVSIKDIIFAIDKSYYFVDFVHIRNLYEDVIEKYENGIYFVNIFNENDFKILKEITWKKMNLIRIYTRDSLGVISKEPVLLKRNSCVKDLAELLHKTFLRNFKYAKIWGKSAKFDGQKVGLEHILEDGDIVEIITK